MKFLLSSTPIGTKIGAAAGLLLASASVHAQDVQGPAAPEPVPVPVTEPVPEPMPDTMPEAMRAPEPITVQEVPPAQTPESAMDPSGMDQEAATPDFTDEQIASFARAAMQIRELGSDETLDETARRAQAELIIADEGLDPETYSAIGAAAAGDPAIAIRVQQAIEAMAATPED